MIPLDHILRLYEAHTGARPVAVETVAADGSQRVYRRLVGADDGTLVGAFGPDPDENRAFLSFSRSLRDAGLPVPRIHSADEEAGVWLMDDLGDTTLFDALTEARAREGGRFPPSMRATYRRVVETLPRFQVGGDRVVDYTVAYPHAAFDRRSILWDLNYFKYHFLKLAHVPFHEARLERDFEALADFLLAADTDFFLYRDFQSRNVMLPGGDPSFIDYQGGRRGALQYDVASLLYDAKADLPPAVRDELLEAYLDALARHVEVDREAWLARYPGYVLVRVMQAMGAYGYRGFFERKPRFLQSVPYAARNVRGILDRGLPLQVPELEAVFRRIVDDWAAAAPDDDDGPAGLVVHVTSFSYRRGYPEDVTGHGGGYVFDCRALPNPGREEAYASFTGLDEAVVDHLERIPETEPFWERTRDLVAAQVEEYLRRGFTSLTVAYGCTGGQHRSPYMAARLGRWLEERFPEARVKVHHRERARWPRASGAAETRPTAAPAGSSR